MRGVTSGLAAGALVLLAGCGGGGGDKTFSAAGYPITFQYPGKLHATSKVSTALNAGSDATDKRAIALDSKNALLLSTYKLRVRVTDANVRQAKAEIDRELAQVEGTTAPSGKITHLAGFPTLEYSGVPVTPPKNGQSRLAFVFAGKTEVELNCQSEPTHRAEIGRYCDKMLATVKKR